LELRRIIFGGATSCIPGQFQKRNLAVEYQQSTLLVADGMNVWALKKYLGSELHSVSQFQIWVCSMNYWILLMGI
jgi:hypothetical protein